MSRIEGIRRTAAVATLVATAAVAGYGANEAVRNASADEGNGGTTPTTECFNGGDLLLQGLPDSVKKSQVDTAKGEFDNTIGKGTEMAFAEPGGLWVGGGFFDREANNTGWGNNPGGADTMRKSGGSIQEWSPVTQDVLDTEGPEYRNLPEGGWQFASAGQLRAEVGSFDEGGVWTPKANPDTGDAMVFDLPHKGEGHNYFLVMRGLYGERNQDTDENLTVRYTCYIPGHTLVNTLLARNDTNVAFLSEDQLGQFAEASHSGGSNSGAEGASDLTMVIVDANTGAKSVLEQNQDRHQNGKKGWNLVESNWR